MTDRRSDFNWQRFPEAEAWLTEIVDSSVASVPLLRNLDTDLIVRCGARLVDWLDHVILVAGEHVRRGLLEFGFEPEPADSDPGDQVFFHPGSIFPRIVLRVANRDAPGDIAGLAIQAEDIRDFLMARHLSVPIQGSPLAPYRRARVWAQDGMEVLVVERRGHSGFVPLGMPPEYAGRYMDALERWASRPRAFTDELCGTEHTLRLARALVAEFGTDTAAWVAFAAERAHWQQRNRAGQVQKARQDSLGLGWANHDHHTFRSSREAFRGLIQVLETLGFRPRERFYAGEEAGWGAQVMEQPAARLAVFADVDLSPDEVTGDFGHVALPPQQRLGTVGLWCALHGSSLLDAGLHHLAARYDFDGVRAGLAEWGVRRLRPFSDFPYLRQAFTQGERWGVQPERLQRLAALGLVSEAQQAQFASNGAIGSHLESIQRGQGFKGFNQQMISDIIRRTDPRTADAEG